MAKKLGVSKRRDAPIASPKPKSGPQVMPHPGDPGFSQKDIKAREELQRQLWLSGHGKMPPGSNAENRSDASRKALRDATAMVPHSQTQPPVANPSEQLPVIDPLGDLNEIYKQLLNNLSNSPAVLNDKQIRKLAEDQIKMQFDPQIQALKQDMAERKERYARNKEEVQDLYSDLANQYRDERGNSVDAYGDVMRQNDMMSQQTDQQMQQNFQNSLDYQTNEFNKLGIGDVAQDNYPEQQRDLQYQQTLNNSESDAFERYLSGNQASTQDYYSKMAGNAGYHGAETIEDLLYELNNSLDNTGSQITSLKGQQGTALSTLIMQIQQQQQERQMQAQQQQFANMLNAGEFGMGLQKMRWDMMNPATGGQQQNLPTSGMLGANQMLSAGSNPQQLMGVFQELLQQQPFRENRFPAADGTIINLSPQQAAQYAQQLGAQRNLSQQDISALVNAVYAYFGKLGR